VSFTRSMREKADKLGVDLLLVDTGVSYQFLAIFSLYILFFGAKIGRISTMELGSVMPRLRMDCFRILSSKTLTMTCLLSVTTSYTSQILHLGILTSLHKY